MKLGIVVSEMYWKDITSNMLDLAIKTAKWNKYETEIVKVPGCFDMPLAIKKLLKKKDIDGVVTLGAIVQGGTDHDKVIAHAVARAMIELSLEFEKPVVNGVNGPKMSWEQAIERIKRAEEVTKACIEMVKTLKNE